MIRKTVYSLAFLCSLIAVAAWISSYRYCAGVWVWYTDRSELFVVVEEGAITVLFLDKDLSVGGSVLRYEGGLSRIIENTDPVWKNSEKILGKDICRHYYFVISPICSDSWEDSRQVTVPFWLIAVGFLSVPLLGFSLRMVFRFRRRRRNQCIACGYSLEGNVSGVCPECGLERVQLKRGNETTDSGRAS